MIDDRPTERLMTIPEVADRLQISVKTVRRLIEKRALIAHVIGAQYRVSELDLDRYLCASRVGGIGELSDA